MNESHPVQSSSVVSPASRTLVLAFCSVFLFIILPLVLNFAGIPLSKNTPPADFDLFAQMTHIERETAVHEALAGSFTHLIFEWTSVAAGLAAFVLCLIHLGVSRNEFLAVLAVALLVGFITDAYHGLASCFLLPAVSDSMTLIPFSWVLGRFFHAFGLLGAVLFFVIPRHRKLSPVKEKTHAGLIFFLGFVISGLAFSVMDFCVSSLVLPDVQVQEGLVKRPLEMLPLLLYAACFVFAAVFIRKRGCYFSKVLSVYLLLNMAVQLYIGLGSTAVFDHYFNSAHLLKITASLIVFAAVLYDFHLLQLKTLAMEDQLAEEAKKSRDAAKQLKTMSREMNELSFVISHDLKTPIRGIQFLAEWFMDDFKDHLKGAGKDTILKIVGRAERMSRLIDGLLEYSEIGQQKRSRTKVNLNSLARACAEKLNPPANVMLKFESTLPVVFIDQRCIETIFTQLFKNAFACADPYEGLVTVTCREETDFWIIGVADNGAGIEKAEHERIFKMFVSLSSEPEKNTGIGLALVKKAVENLRGKVWVESVLELGTTFYFTLPKEIAETDEA